MPSMFPRALLALCAHVYTASAVNDTSCAKDGACADRNRGDLLLQVDQFSIQSFVEESVSDYDRISTTGPRPSCLDKNVAEYLPDDLNQNYNNVGAEFTCRWEVDWGYSDFIMKMMADHNEDPRNFRFRLCWDDRSDPEVRNFAWVHSTSGDWRYQLTAQNSVMLTPMQLFTHWKDGFLNVMPDALDYFARMGEVGYGKDGLYRKIIPKFMMYGWSKGATFQWPIARWRPDLVQGIVLVHGCKSNKYWEKEWEKKAQYTNLGMVPHLWFGSEKDTYVKCTHKDGTKQKQKDEQKGAKHAKYVETPCGHHPDQCWPLCDYNETYVNRFWEFVELSYQTHQPIAGLDEAQCTAMLGTWDAELGKKGECVETFPWKLGPSCERFCGKNELTECGDADDAEECEGSFTVLSVEAANAKGMHAKCYYDKGMCKQASQSFQCFFQDDCP